MVQPLQKFTHIHITNEVFTEEILLHCPGTMHPAVGPKPVQAEWKRALIDSSGGFFTEVPKAASKYQNEVLKVRLLV